MAAQKARCTRVHSTFIIVAVLAVHALAPANARLGPETRRARIGAHAASAFAVGQFQLHHFTSHHRHRRTEMQMADPGANFGAGKGKTDAVGRHSRRCVLQSAAAGSALLAVGGVILSPHSPVWAANEAKETAAVLSAGIGGRLYDLGLNNFHRAPGRLLLLEPPVRSPADEKAYRALTLPNGLRVLLTSDVKADVAAAALNVHVGHFSDPDNLPGLAHFCEHMLFLGNEKYPREGELETFLARNAGRSNAFTGNEETCYYFTVNQNACKGALDIFSQFFVAPLFSASGVEREINAVNSENAKNLNSDSWRIGQTSKLHSNQRHPIAKFGTGNAVTLSLAPKAAGIDVRDELMKFHETYYSANQMTLAVSSRQDLDTLQAWVEELFSDVPNKDVPPAEAGYAGIISARQPGAEEYALAIEPLQDLRSLDLSWQVPFISDKDREMRMLSKPHQVLGALINYEGKGSLAAFLKNDLGLINSMQWSFSRTSDMEIFSVSFGLTRQGLERKDDIIGYLFSYLNLIKVQGVPAHLINEVSQLADIFWRFKEAEGPRSVIGYAGNMQKFAASRDWLAGSTLIRAPIQVSAVIDLTRKLTPEDALVSYISREVGSSPKVLTEKWYGTKYERIMIDRSQWTKQRLPSTFKLPGPNPFIPANFDILNALEQPPADGPSPPKLVLDSNTWRVFVKSDTTYGKPKAYAYFNIALPEFFVGSQTSAQTQALNRLYELFLSQSLTEVTYDASLAGLSYSFGVTPRGVVLSFSGFNDKLPAFISAVASAVVSYLPSDETQFAKFKDILSRNLVAFNFQQPYQHASFYASQCLSVPSSLPTDTLAALDSITLPELQRWVKGLWKNGYGQALIQGNIDEEQALRCALEVAEAFSLQPLDQGHRGAPKSVQLPLTPHGHGYVLRRQEPNTQNPNSAVLVQFQHGNRDAIKEQLCMEVLGSMVGNPFFTSLRTKQQLGYVVSAGVQNREGVRSLVFTVQSGVADTSTLTEKIFEFVQSFSLDDFSDEQIDDYIRGLVAKKVQRDTRLSTEVARHWSEIVIGRYDYTRARTQADVLQTIRRADLQATFSNIISSGGSGRRVLTTQVASALFRPATLRSNGAESQSSTPADKGGMIISDPGEFVSKNALFPPYKGYPGSLTAQEKRA